MREDRLGMHVMAEKTGIAQRWVIADAVEFAVNGGGGEFEWAGTTEDWGFKTGDCEVPIVNTNQSQLKRRV